MGDPEEYLVGRSGQGDPVFPKATVPPLPKQDESNRQNYTCLWLRTTHHLSVLGFSDSIQRLFDFQRELHLTSSHLLRQAPVQDVVVDSDTMRQSVYGIPKGLQ